MTETKYPTNEELATAVEKILAAVRDLLTFTHGLSDEEWTKFKDAEDRRRVVHGLSDDEWTKFKDAEDRRRQARPAAVGSVRTQPPECVDDRLASRPAGMGS